MTSPVLGLVKGISEVTFPPWRLKVADSGERSPHPDSNLRSLREGKGYGQPLQASIAVSGLNLVSGSTFRAAVSEWQERDRWFESGSLQRRVRFISEPLPPTSGASTACCGRARRCRPNPSRRPKDLPAPQGDATRTVLTAALVVVICKCRTREAFCDANRCPVSTTADCQPMPQRFMTAPGGSA